MIQMFQAWITAFKQSKWMLMLAVFFLLISAMLFWFWQRTQQTEEKYRQAVVLQQEQLEQAQELGKALHISQMNAKELQAAERINKQDTTLPPAALEKTDRTAVVKNDTEYKVDVLKINLDKAWELSAGVGSHRGDSYIPLGVQRNYASHKAVAAEVHLVPEDLAKGKIKASGWEVKHVWRF